MSSQPVPHSHSSMYQLNSDAKQAVACRGVIKKLFPTKLYGFVVLECADHLGEAHFNYSDLCLDEHERKHLCIGWRVEFGVLPQERPTPHCVFRAIQVRPIKAMVVQCELQNVLTNEIISFVSRELGGKLLYCHKKMFNGHCEGPASKETCRAALTWSQLLAANPMISHCSQDTPAARDGRDNSVQGRGLGYKSAERRTSRKDPTSFNSYASGSGSHNSSTSLNASANHSHGRSLYSDASQMDMFGNGRTLDFNQATSIHQRDGFRSSQEQGMDDSGLPTSPENTSTGSLNGMTTSTPRPERQSRLSLWSRTASGASGNQGRTTPDSSPTKYAFSPVKITNIWNDPTPPSRTVRDPQSLSLTLREPAGLLDHPQWSRDALTNGGLINSTASAFPQRSFESTPRTTASSVAGPTSPTRDSSLSGESLFRTSRTSSYGNYSTNTADTALIHNYLLQTSDDSKILNSTPPGFTASLQARTASPRSVLPFNRGLSTAEALRDTLNYWPEPSSLPLSPSLVNFTRASNNNCRQEHNQQQQQPPQ